MQTADISIIIPIYNVQDYLIECLESVVKQTFAGMIECILVDDCGSDNSIALAQHFIENNYNPRFTFKILHHSKNRGLSAARNTGVIEATGNFIFFLDSDDAITTECIEQMMEVVEKYPNVEMVQGGINNIAGKAIYDIQNKNLPDYCDNVRWIKNNLLLTYLIPGSSWNKLINRQFLLNHQITQVEGIIYEDAPYSFHLAQKLNNIGFCKHNTYLYRTQRTGSITSTAKEEKSLESRLIILNYCLDLVDNRFKEIQMRSLMLKCLTYLNMHQLNLLQKHNQEIDDIISKLIQGMPFPRKIFTFLYASLPLKIQHSTFCTKFFRKVFSEKIHAEL